MTDEMKPASFEATTEKPQPTKAAKKRVKKALKQVAAEKGISGPAVGAETIALSGDTAKLAKRADDKAIRTAYVAAAQKDAESIVREFKEYFKFCEEADTAVSNRDAYFKNRICIPEFYRRCQNVRDFFATKRSHEYLLGSDGITQYTRAKDYFLAEVGVTFQYVSQQMLKQRELYETLTGDKLPPKSKAGGRRTGGAARGTDSSDSPAGKVNIDELPEEVRNKVLAVIDGTPTETAAENAEDVPLSSLSVDDRVRHAFAALSHFMPQSPRDRDEFLTKLAEKLDSERQFEILATAPPIQVQLTEGDPVAA
jgi:hypothetical protein